MAWIQDIDEAIFPLTDRLSGPSEAYLLAWGDHVFKPPTLPRFAGQPGSVVYCPRELWWEYEFTEPIEQAASDSEEDDDDDDEERDRPRRSLVVVLRVAVPQQTRKIKSYAGVRKNKKQLIHGPATSLGPLKDDERLSRELQVSVNGLRRREGR